MLLIETLVFNDLAEPGIYALRAMASFREFLWGSSPFLKISHPLSSPEILSMDFHFEG